MPCQNSSITIDLAEYARHSRAHIAVWRPLATVIATPIFWLLGGIRASHKDRVPDTGGVLILSNHLADVDPVVIQLACPRRVHFMAKSELFEMGLLGKVIRAFGGYPVKRKEPDRAALKFTASLLRDGEPVVVFPEGEISETAKLQELKAGIALIVRLAPDVPVICCGIQNTHKVMPYGKMIPRPAFKRMIVNWGQPRVFGKDASVDEIIGWATAQLEGLTAES